MDIFFKLCSLNIANIMLAKKLHSVPLTFISLTLLVNTFNLPNLKNALFLFHSCKTVSLPLIATHVLINVSTFAHTHTQENAANMLMTVIQLCYTIGIQTVQN